MKKRVVMFGLLGLTLGVMAVQAQEMPMAGMKKGSAASQAASMTEMMGAPGLVPFDIMTGQAGKWMVGYQFMFEKLGGILVGTQGISKANVLNRFKTTPTDMTMQMHMGMIMYAPTNKLTLMAMLPYVKMSIEPTKDPNLQGGKRLSILFGITFHPQKGLLKVYTVRASKEEPQYLIKSDVISEHRAMHKGSVLKKLKSRQ